MSTTFKLKLLREDVPLDSIPELPSEVLLSAPVITRKNPQALINDVRVNFVKRIGE